MSRAVVAEELYTFPELCGLLKLGRRTGVRMLSVGSLPAHDVVVPGAGAKGRRWSASRVRCIQEGWRATHAAGELPASVRDFLRRCEG